MAEPEIELTEQPRVSLSMSIEPFPEYDLAVTLTKDEPATGEEDNSNHLTGLRLYVLISTHTFAYFLMLINGTIATTVREHVGKGDGTC